ncbi:MAG: sensor histidine kinase N-terminal domain-containing protein [Chromatiaceae bacterium]|nr:sensor histidine kinase N-terminal domain-containing protein [Chromatiaceae bacterium]
MKALPSIRRRLLAMLISSMLLVWVVALLLVYRSAQHEVEEVFDADLARSAHILQALLLHEVQDDRDLAGRLREVAAELGEQGVAASPRLARIIREYLDQQSRETFELASTAQQVGHRYVSGLAFVARYPDGSEMMRDRAAPDIPPGDDGYVDRQLQDEAWRVYGLTDRDSGLIVQVGERQAFRNQLVRYITRNTLMPLLLALPVLALLIWGVVGHALGPLQLVAEEVAKRDPDALEPIEDADAPREIRTLLTALNKLLGRVGSAIMRERQFTADAAHELRTPLAALKTHLQVARAGTAEVQTRHSLDQALEGVDRATHSVAQLLLLARADAEETRALVNAKIDLREVAFQVVAALSQQALERKIDLGIDAPGPLLVRGDATSLQVMLRNLVDNAVRYTPHGGSVTVSLGGAARAPWLQVADDGAGIAPGEREKMFDRFHRGRGEQSAHTTGSGLGLSIVQRIADLHQATIELGDGLHGRGLGVRVVFPAT